MRNILKHVVFFLIVFPLPALSGSSGGKVNNVIVNAYNYLFFSAGTQSGSPACSQGNQWAVDITQAKGKSIYALLLAAQAQDKLIYVIGNDTCDAWGDRETVLYVTMP